MPKFEVEVQHSISVTVTVEAADADAAHEIVNTRDYPLPPRDEWNGHKDWSYLVSDAETGEELAEYNR